MRRKVLAALCLCFIISGLAQNSAQASVAVNTEKSEPAPVLTQDIEQFIQLLESPHPKRRIEGIQGLSHLKHWPAEEILIQHLQDDTPEVRLHALLALCRLGGVKTVPHLIELLGHRSWEIRRNAWLGLERLTGQTFPADALEEWHRWWKDWPAIQPALWEKMATGFSAPERGAFFRAMRHLAGPADELRLIDLLDNPPTPPLDADERTFICEAFERIGAEKAIPVLARQRTDAAAWALGAIGGLQAEQALLQYPKRLPVILALDRLGSTNAGSFIPHLVANMGLITYRSQPDDVMNEELQPIQRAGLNLIRRTGLAPLLIERVLQELENSMDPPILADQTPECPPDWIPMLEQMREELKPGFVRNDGVTTSQPLAALAYVVDDPGLVERLVPLLRHPAYVPRVYVALALGYLRAQAGLPALVEIIEEGYAFSDAVELASGKHFDKSQTIRWRGFLCMALGRMGGDGAREALEKFATDPDQPRDVRYSSVVGLGLIASPYSIPVLDQIARDDLIWMVRDEALQAIEKIQLMEAENRLLAGSAR